MEDSIQHISDTAFWIAGFRAQETERKDAVFKDTLAKKLSGEKGLQMVAETPHSAAMAFAMVARTVAIDRHILSAVSQGIDAVINLGAGLDTRPYRLNLPTQLKWIEVDFTGLVNYKNEKLATDNPVCQLKRIAANLSDDTERRHLLSKLGSEVKKALVITEGVIGYLTNDQAAKLSKDIFSIPSFAFWVQDYAQGKMKNHRRSKDMVKKMVKHTPIQFRSADPISFFGEHGWRLKENIFILDEADMIGRSMPMMFPWNILIKLPAVRQLGNKTYGYAMFAKA
jgi:methyltransferase (TIGR00027 family)